MNTKTRRIAINTMSKLNPRRLTALAAIAASGILLASMPIASAAEPQPLSDAQIHAAQPVSDWPGFAKIARDGNFYFAAQPSEAALRQAPERDIKVVVNLRTDAEMADRDKVAFDEAALVRDLGISYVTIPVTPKTLSIKDVEKLEEVLRNTSGPVLIHCHSSNRVGVLFGLYLNQFRGFDLPDAIDLGVKAGAKETGVAAIKQAAAAWSATWHLH